MTTIISSTLELIRRQLDQSLRTAYPGPDDWVRLSNLVDHQGRAYEQLSDRVVMVLANILRESSVASSTYLIPANHNQAAVVTQPLFISLHLLFYANFTGSKYSQGLDFVSHTISFFQKNPTFTDENLPGLDHRIGKLAIEWLTLDVADLHHLMGAQGVNYLPSVCYRLRVIPYADMAPSHEPIA